LAFFAFIFFILSRRPIIFISFFFIIFTFAWRLTATMFIDLEGPVYSSQLVRDVGPGIATVIHSIAYIVILIPFLYFFRQSEIDRWCAEAEQTRTDPQAITLSDATFAIFVIFFLMLLFDLARNGTIPLFGRMERYQYSGGLAHRLISQYGNFFAFWCGLVFAARYIRDRRFDARMLGLLCAMLVYAFLTGSRFSAFYSQCGFFIIPWGGVIALQQGTAGSSSSWIGQTFASRRSRFIAVGLIAALATVVSFALYNNLTKVRGYADAEVWNQFFERVLIQPSEIGWSSFERVFEHGQSDPPVAFNFLFQHPIEPSRNTSIQYLMFATIGEPRTTDQVLHGFQLAGGFPEILFELFGPYLAWLFLLGAGCMTAALTAYVIKGVLLGNYASAFLAMYVLFGFYVMYIGGMLNFVMPWTYWVKVAAFVIVLITERSLANEGFSLLPWNLIAIRRTNT
jgi:Family of unknown function (DUF6418)